MADIFISYNSEDKALTDKIVDALEREGFTVWYDSELEGGKNFDAKIERELERANAILAVWSPAALKSRWVRTKALHAFDETKLVSAIVAGPTTLELPLPFRHLRSIDLRVWDPDHRDDPSWVDLVAVLRSIIAQRIADDRIVRPVPDRNEDDPEYPESVALEETTVRTQVEDAPILRRVFFGTDRQIERATHPVSFSSDIAEELTYGRVDVTIPPNERHQIGRLESPLGFGGIRFPYDPMRHITVAYIHLLERNGFLQQLSNDSLTKSLFIFVHGFNTSFEDSARRTAQLHYDLKLTGPAISYSWTSAGKLGPTAYNRDRDMATISAQHLRDFLDMLIAETGATAINIVAHSMGNQTLVDAINGWTPSRPRPLTQIVMVAPDVNKARFMQLAQAFKTAGERATLYGSRRDFALLVSRAWSGDLERAGDAKPPVVLAGVDTIDVSDMEIPNDPLSHFLLDDDRVLSDIKEILDADLPPDRRMRLMETANSNGSVYWRMKRK